jgi:hypothetical protein
MNKYDSARHHNKKLRSTDYRSHVSRSGRLWPWALLWLCNWPLAGLAAPASQDGGDEQRWFQVELILFAQNQGGALDSEKWPDLEDIRLPQPLQELSLPQPEPAPDTAPEQAALATTPIVAPDGTGKASAGEATAAVEPPPAMPVAFQLLPEEELQLNDVLAKLRRSRHYHPLLHIAWNQPTLGREQATPILLFEGMAEPLPADEAAAEATSEAEGEAATAIPAATTFSLQPVPATEADADIGPPNPRFVGTVRVSVARYLHLDADLLYRIPVTQQQPVPIPDLTLWYDRPYPTLSEPQGPAYQLQEWQAMRGFRLEESRRMRSGRVHYLDNPFLGLVVLITPVELPPPPAAEVTLDPLNRLGTPTEGKVLRTEE